ncbi:putative membrane protein YqjE [Cupriavidus gilardii J11]|uniref:Putative membrane protein YqjE n=1 Tax=Cupriavidus gilardii J11 TaxID=936133 RepID=A0A562BLW5_9BURK|nr:phage holin family protein [Cupriavidus gilardii]TWG86227.1 putative membrane protein YqjE [Cupriavidus gilardii J11]
MTDDTHSPKLMDSLRTLASSSVSMLQTRLELASVELSEEKNRLLRMALLALVGLVFFGLSLFALTGLVVLLFWDNYRVQALGALIVIYLAIAAGCMLAARNILRNAPALFEATLAEIDKDRESLRQ